MIACDAETTADSPDAQSRFSVTPATDSGSPASSSAMRATLRLSSPAWFAQPKYTSSIAAGIDARPLDRGRDRDRGEVVGPDARERAAVAADRRPHAGEDDCALACSATLPATKSTCDGRGNAPSTSPRRRSSVTALRPSSP